MLHIFVWTEALDPRVSPLSGLSPLRAEEEPGPLHGDRRRKGRVAQLEQRADLRGKSAAEVQGKNLGDPIKRFGDMPQLALSGSIGLSSKLQPFKDAAGGAM